MTGRTVVIGLGNPWRQDDGAGQAVARAVERRRPACAGLEVTTLDGEPARLLDAWEGADLAVVVDAVRGGAPPGTVLRLDPTVAEPGTSHSSHGLGLTEAVALGRRLGRLPERLVVVGVVGATFGDGPGLSPAVASAVDDAAALVISQIADR